MKPRTSEGKSFCLLTEPPYPHSLPSCGVRVGSLSAVTALPREGQSWSLPPPPAPPPPIRTSSHSCAGQRETESCRSKAREAEPFPAGWSRELAVRDLRSVWRDPLQGAGRRWWWEPWRPGEWAGVCLYFSCSFSAATATCCTAKVWAELSNDRWCRANKNVSH